MSQKRYSRSFIWRLIDIFLVYWAWEAFTRGEYFRAALYGVVGGGSLIVDIYRTSKYGSMIQQQQMQASTFTQTGPSLGDFASFPNLRPYTNPEWSKQYNRMSIIKERGYRHLLGPGNVDEKIQEIDQIDNEFIFQGIYLNAEEPIIRSSALKNVEDKDFLKYLAIFQVGDNPYLIFEKIDDINFKIDLLQLPNYKFKAEIIQTLTEMEQMIHVASINLKGIVSIKRETLLNLLDKINKQQAAYKLIDQAIKAYDQQQAWDSVVYTTKLAKLLPDGQKVELVQSIFNIPRFQQQPGYFAMIQSLLTDVDTQYLKREIAPQLQRLYHNNHYSFSLLKMLFDSIPEEFRAADKKRLIGMLFDASEEGTFIRQLLLSTDYEELKDEYKRFLNTYPKKVDQQILERIGDQEVVNHYLSRETPVTETSNE